MKKQQDSSTRAAALQITFSVALLFTSAIWLASAAPTNPKEASGPGRLGVHSQRGIADPMLGNYPDTSLPLSTDTTVTPDAAPTDTTSINVSTSTDFNGTLAGDPTTGVVRVTNAHPAGTYTVTVTAFDSGGATASKTFTLTVTTPVTCNPVYFPTATNFPADYPSSVAVGDFNGDGNQDLATANQGSNNVSILLGDGTGNFSAATNFPAGDGPSSVVVGDFNGDGNQDLAVANRLFPGDTVSILLGDGTGNFSAATNFPVGAGPGSVAVGDFNGDGNQDLAVANLDSIDSNNVSILLGDGTGNFSAATNFPAGIEPRSLAVGDFNGDGNQDLAVTHYNGPNNVSILLGDGTGHFSAATNFPVGASAQSVAVGDFNGDGNQDLATANFFSNDVSILLGDGTGHFSAATNFTVGTEPYSVAVGDFNGDGNQDIAVASVNSNDVSILLGDGTGNFSITIIHPGGGQFSVAVGDFNDDGLQDLATANAASDVSILIRDCPGTGVLLNAASRLTHGYPAGTFDINMPLTGTPGVEDRSSSTYNAVFTFDAPVTSGAVTVLSGTATVGAITFSGNQMTAALTGVTDIQTVVLHTENINGDGMPHGDVPFSFLIGDVNGDGSTDLPDKNSIGANKGVTVTGANFRNDLDISGTINVQDKNLLKANKNHHLP